MLLRSTALAGLRPEPLRVSAIRRPSTFAKGGAVTKRIMPWPQDGGPLALEDLARPVLHAIRFAYDLNRRDRRRNIPWRGPEIVDTGTLACCPPITERLKAHRLADAEEDQGRDTLEEIVCAALQLGIEQGRRIAKSSVQELLSETYGATFTLSVGYDHTHLHTQSGIMADPVECLRRAVVALTDEMARVQRCPRQRALARDSGRLPEGEDSRSEAECEASQSGGATSAASPVLKPPNHPSNREAT